MARKTRKSLAEKMKKVYAEAKKKEKLGLETTHERLYRLSLRGVVYRTEDYFFLNDGSYVARCGWDSVSGRNIWFHYDNVPADLLEYVFESAHAEECDKRRKNEHEDKEYEWFLSRDYDDYDYEKYPNPIERKLVREGYGNPENIVINKMDDNGERSDEYSAIDFKDLPLNPVIGYNADGSFDSETKYMMCCIIHSYVESLPEKRKERFYWYFGTELLQKEIAEMEGLTKHAISKWKNRFAKEMATVLTRFGYYVLGVEEFIIEAAEQIAYNEHYRSVQEELDNLYECDEDMYDDEGMLILA